METVTHRQAARAQVVEVLVDRQLDGAIEADLALGDLAERGDGRLVVALDHRRGVVGELPSALGAEDDEGETGCRPARGNLRR